MVSKVVSGAVNGVEGQIVVIEVDISPGLPGTDVVGLPDSAVRESKERIRAAIKNTGFRLPPNRITINLAPAGARKAGAAFDLPMAVGILCGIEAIPVDRVKGVFITGELSLDGQIQPVSGILSMIDNASRQGIKRFVVPYDNRREAALIKGVRVAAIKTLADLVDFFKSGRPPVYDDSGSTDVTEAAESELDFSDVKGQEHVKRALEIAATGGHNVLMIGPPGSGKTMLAKRMPSILGRLSFEESIEVTKIYSVAGLTRDNDSLIDTPPFRSPHHTVSNAALIGGGKFPKPGEVSLAHNGVLFLDEFPEFHKDVREGLRQPMEDGVVSISRAQGKTSYPSRFMLICAMNPCPCGHYGDGDKCSCTYQEVAAYQEKLSGPLLDRIDIHIDAPRVDYEKLQSGHKPESSAVIRERVAAAREIQRSRYAGSGVSLNARLTEPQVEAFCPVDDECGQMLKKAYDVMNMSARAYHKVLKIARTIADLSGGGPITQRNLAEALQYRGLDRRFRR